MYTYLFHLYSPLSGQPKRWCTLGQQHTYNINKGHIRIRHTTQLVTHYVHTMMWWWKELTQSVLFLCLLLVLSSSSSLQGSQFRRCCCGWCHPAMEIFFLYIHVLSHIHTYMCVCFMHSKNLPISRIAWSLSTWLWKDALSMWCAQGIFQTRETGRSCRNVKLLDLVSMP